MKRTTMVFIFGCALALMWFFDSSISYGKETDYSQTIGNLQVITPNDPGELPEPVKPVYPLAPEQPIISDQLTPAIQQGAPARSLAVDKRSGNYPEPIEVNTLKSSVEKATKDWLGFNFISRTIPFTIKRGNAESITVYAEPLYVTLSDHSQKEAWPHYVQLSDERGRYSGWTLSVKQESQFTRISKSAEQQLLTGAQLSLGTEQGPAELLGTGANDQFKPTKVSTKTNLIPQVAADLIVAQADQGLGTWIYRFGNEKTLNKSIALMIPANQYKEGNYTSILRWSLLDAPVA